jgi:hypothetical protein
MEINKFDAIAKVQWLAEHNKLCQKYGFEAVFASGPENLEGVMAKYRSTENFIIIDDTSDNRLYCGKPGWFTISTVTIWIVAATRYNDGEDHNKKMELCRTIFRQFISRLLFEKQKQYATELMFLDLDNVLYKELGRYSLNGATGLYFMLDSHEPTNLVCNEDEWC